MAAVRENVAPPAGSAFETRFLLWKPGFRQLYNRSENLKHFDGRPVRRTERPPLVAYVNHASVPSVEAAAHPVGAVN